MIGDLTLSQLLTHIVTTVQTVFAPRWTTLVLPDTDAADHGPATALRVAASAGESLADEDISSVTSGGGQARSLGWLDDANPRRVSVALVVNHRPVGMLVLQDVQLVEHDRSLLGTFANQAALAVDRAQLSEQALRTRLLEEIDRWRRALMGAASHDLRTPLAAIKTAVSSMRQVDARLSPEDRAELLELIELQSDRLARLVTNLLDMTRLEAGALELRPTTVGFDRPGRRSAGPAGRDRGASAAVTVERAGGPAAAPPRSCLDEPGPGERARERRAHLPRRQRDPRDGAAARPATRSWSRSLSPTTARASHGEDRERVFEMFSQNGGGGRAGLGLAIAKAFVEAHGGQIWIDPDVDHGARIVFTVPAGPRVTAAV